MTHRLDRVVSLPDRCLTWPGSYWYSMPFTLSHAAVVVPFRRMLPFSALVIGSMVPDLPYFVPRLVNNHFAHGTLGFFVFCLPPGMAALRVNLGSFGKSWTIRLRWAMVARP